MREVLQLLPFAAIFGLFGLAMWLLLRWERKRAGTWTAIAEGAFDRAEYGYYTYSRRSGAMVHTTSYHRMDVTAVYFDDGRTCVMRGRHDMTFPRGTKVRVWRNGLGGHRLERLA